ncbi:Transcriptional repressor NF-X1 [Modicella reniformis]|uniref:Transcriptional repressor NF-X1 n=1 Tax=Modicella reniformis TaxID=1440133 RepID=A0A9P6SQA6_9FUNG|nr:Transcriptional repressor NF-X1 [Modicella reniformis]
MSDSIPPAANVPRGRSAAKSGEGQDNRSEKTTGRLNPEAKDYVPRTATVALAVASSSEGAGNTGSSTTNPRTTTSQAGSGSGYDKSRGRRIRNPGSGKSGITGNSGNSEANKPNKPLENGQDRGNGHGGVGGAGDGSASTSTSTGRSNGIHNKNQRNRNRGHNPQRSIEGGARIDDDDNPVEPSEGQATGSGSNGMGKSHREGRNSKGKEMSNSSLPKHQRNKGDKGLPVVTAANANEQAESSSSAGNTNNNSNKSTNNNNNRHQRNRRGGDLHSRMIPAVSDGSKQTGESSGSQRTAQRKTPRSHPKKQKHTVEGDRDLMAALTTGLSNSTYECMVCWDVIRPAHRIWNCQVCWAAFHLDCLSTWAKKSSEAMERVGDVQDVRTLKYLSPRNTFAFVPKSAALITIDTLLRILVASSVDAPGNALIPVTFLAIQVHVLHVVVRVLSRHVIAAMRPSSCVA